MPQLNHIVLITSGQPSLNPRLVKEADTLADAGYRVTVLYAYWNDWGTEIDNDLIISKKWKAIRFGGDPVNEQWTYFFSRLIHKLAKIINQKVSNKLMRDSAIARPAQSLMRGAAKIDADLYIGHNLGALPATLKAAKMHKRPCGFDAEDFHRNEVSDDNNKPDVILKSTIENLYIPMVDYLSVSSPLIAEEYMKIFPSVKPQVILNVFPQAQDVKPPVINNETAVRLFWFSQTIGINRGLEEVLSVLEQLTKDSFELHLLGHLSVEGDKMLSGRSLNVRIHDPIPPNDIPAFASQFDIGLATENSTPLNRDICLTNKIFSYMQAGLAIVASDTTAQKQLLAEYPAIGKLYLKNNFKSLADTLGFYHIHRNELFEARRAALTVAKSKLNWENESTKFLNIVKQTLNKN